jgi:2-keto-4-pentenoate hydratase/2-oxohepta-3-ene-1,7-dioic acid hydratase in catechol pathway
MRWVTFRHESDEDRVGRVIDDLVYVLEGGVQLIDLLGDDGERLHQAGERAERDPRGVVPLDQVRLRPPLPRPNSVRDFYAFEQHARAGRRSRGQELPPEWYSLPVFYFSNPAALIGHDEVVPVPPGCTALDYEVEVAAVVGRACRDVSPTEAGRHIIGFTVMNDWSARDLQRQEMRLGLGPAKAKDFATTLGPSLVTVDELEPYRKGTAFDLAMTACVNGREYTRGNLADLYWSYEEMLSYAARGTTVQAGDVIGSGTCATGCILELSQTHGQDAYPWLTPGDVVEVSVDVLGTLRNEIRPGVAPKPLRDTVHA